MGLVFLTVAPATGLLFLLLRLWYGLSMNDKDQIIGTAIEGARFSNDNQEITGEGGVEEAKQPYTDVEGALIHDAFKLGVETPQEVCFETKLDYLKVMAWFGWKDNTAIAERLRTEPLWEAKKKIFAEAKSDIFMAKWLLTHHKDSKKDWSPRVENTGAGGSALIPVGPERKALIKDALDKM